MSAHTSQKRILVVDDEQEMRFLLTERLSAWGYEVLAADDGLEAWRIAKEQRPDLILLDIMMPKFKGRDFCELLKAHPETQEIPVIFLTALGLPDHIKAGLDLGAEDYIVKPFESEDLKDRIRICLSRHSHLQKASREASNGSSNTEEGGTDGRAAS